MDKNDKKKANLMLFYKNITALSSEKHRNLKLTPSNMLAFAAHTHWVPVAGSEFAALSTSLPVVFVRETEGDDAAISAIALLGLSVGQNDILKNDMSWPDDVYIPAFIRRYPFVPASNDEASDQLTVCIDEDAPHFIEDAANKGKGKALFESDGKPTAFMEEAMQFLQNFHIEMQRTKSFIEKLKEYDLLTARNARIEDSNGSVFQVADMLVVDEEKLNALDAGKLKDLASHGLLGMIYAHLLSLNNLPMLLKRHNQKLSVSPKGNA